MSMALASETPVVIDADRGVVGESFVFVNAGLTGAGGDAGRGDLVVDAPADVLGPGLAAIAPPGVGTLSGIRAEAAIDINPAQFVDDAAQPGPLFG